MATRTEQADEIKELVKTCREYIIGLTMEVERRRIVAESTDQIARGLELAAYCTHCEHQPSHTQLALRSAMGVFSKAGCHATAAIFARRLIDANPADAKVLTQVSSFGRRRGVELTCRRGQCSARETATPGMPSKCRTTTTRRSISARRASHRYIRDHRASSRRTRARGTFPSTRTRCVLWMQSRRSVCRRAGCGRSCRCKAPAGCLAM